MSRAWSRFVYALCVVILTGLALKPTPITGAQLSPTHQDRDLSTKASSDLSASYRENAKCDSLYRTLPESAGQDLVDLLLAANYVCIADLEWVDNVQLQHAIANEINVLDVAYALSEVAQSYDGFAISDLENLMRFLRVIEDIHFWCIRQGPSSGGNCTDEMWVASQPWDTSPGSTVHRAIFDAVQTIRVNPHFANSNDTHADMLFELTGLIREYKQSADHLEMVVWWLINWGERYQKSSFKLVMDAMFDVLTTGHENRERFGTAFGEHSELLDTLQRRALEFEELDDDWQFIATRSAVEIGRFSIYPSTSNYGRVREVVNSIRTAYLEDESLKPIWLRVIAELDYNDRTNCTHYGTCEWYAGSGFNVNFRNAVFDNNLECPRSYCPDDRVTIHAQNLNSEQLTLACERLDDVANQFHPRFDTDCEPVSNDFNRHLDIYVFHDIRSCEDYSSAAFFRNADTCSGIYYEWDPADPSTRPYFVATQFEDWEVPPDPRLSIWNFEHEYAHYLDGRYNVHGGYRGDIDSLHWWTEGVAEYIAALVSPHLYPPPFKTEHTLAEILLHSDSLPTTYQDRHLTVRFFMDNDRNFISLVIDYLRRGEYGEYTAFLKQTAESYSAVWDKWLRTGGQNMGEGDSRYVLVPLLLAAENENQNGFVRLANLSDRRGNIEIIAIDDVGNRSDPITLPIGAQQTVHFNSNDLEDGNPSKGLPYGVGSGEGNWRLEVTTELQIFAIGYAETANGLQTPMSGVARKYRGGYLVPLFNPADDTGQRSFLRIGNLTDEEVSVTITGIDEIGANSGEIKTQIGPYATTTLSADELETGSTKLNGDLGHGQGKWRLFVSSTKEIFVMSLAESLSGRLVNLSSLTGEQLLSVEILKAVVTEKIPN